MPSLIDRFTAIVRRTTPKAHGKTTADEVGKPRQMGSYLSRLTPAVYSRSEKINLCREMYSGDPRAKGAINTLARDIAKGGFQVKVKSGPNRAKAQALADAMIETLNLPSRLDDWSRLTFRDGDSFIEVSVDESGMVMGATRKPTLEMHRNSNGKDQFEDVARAFWWGDEMYGQNVPAPDDPRVVWFPEWQVIHARWDHDEGSRYGGPMFGPGISAWRKVVEGETDIAVRRKTRSGVRYWHALEGADPADLERYKVENEDSLNNPFAAVADFFTNKAVTIHTLQGDGNLGEIGDVQHHIETWWVSCPVPMALIGYGGELNRDVLQEKLDQYERALEGVTAWLDDQFIYPLLERQWLLQGIWPGSLEYEIVRPSRKALSAPLVESAANAMLKLKATGVFSNEAILTLGAQLMPGVDIDRLLADLARLEAAQAAAQDNEAQRMAALVRGGKGNATSNNQDRAAAA
jgi:hypothetical protein